MKVNFDFHTCMQKFRVPLQVAIELGLLKFKERI
jgi:hypothetical protein